jgi:adenine deaminase
MASFSGKVVDVVNKRIVNANVEVVNGRIQSVREINTAPNNYILPGLIDAHIHIESSMLKPSEFARMAVVHGTVASVSDPHEIANVLGIAGVRYMINNGNKVPFKFYFGAPSCVPATDFETSGARLDVKDIRELLNMDQIHYLSEMMNYPGVIHGQQDVLDKVAVAHELNKPVDGHAPGLMGADLKSYAGAGITTDHECFSMEEAIAKIQAGMKVQIREGSAAKNFEELSPLIQNYADQLMLCSDDKHPDDLVKGHINDLIKRSIAKGYDPLEVIRICTLNPVRHYKLNVGLLQEGDPADFIIVDNLKDFNVLETYINGNLVAQNGSSLIQYLVDEEPNKFIEPDISVNSFQLKT